MNNSEIREHVRQVCAEYDAANPRWREYELERKTGELERRNREVEIEQQARKAREVEQQQEAATNWYAMIDARLEQHFFSGDLGVGGAFKDAIGGALRKKAAQLRGEFKHALNDLTDAFGAEIAALEQRLKAVPGKLPVSKIWRPESVVYGGELVSYDGASYQALRDTAQAPGGSDWVCVARAGRDGLSPTVRGTFNATTCYKKLDIIEFDRSSFIALHDDPGLPGDGGWQLIASHGGRGERGEVGLQGRKGERGIRGEDAPTIINLCSRIFATRATRTSTPS